MQYVNTPEFRIHLAKALHDADCGCKDFGDPTTDEDDRYIKAVDHALVVTFAHQYVAEHPDLMERLRVAHRCEADDTGRIEDCPFGGEGHNFEQKDEND